MRPAQKSAFWLIPPLVCLAIYWQALFTWFQQDDFAWLGLHLSYHQPSDLWGLLFSPGAQGTFRPWSERVFFLVGYSLFGYHPFPFHAIVFATQFANLWLLGIIVYRITGSRALRLLAPLFWAVNSVLAVGLSWVSAYNQILCSFFILLAFHFFLRYVEQGRRRDLIYQWIIFLLGFGVLEVNVVYPALATGYALCLARKHIRTTLWMWIPSAAYGVAHFLLVPKPATGVYALHFDARIGQTLWTYWTAALGPSQLAAIRPGLGWFVPLATTALTLFLLGFALWRFRRGDYFPVFSLVWFIVVLLPVAPLLDHISDYYLTLPTAGLAMLFSWTLVQLWKGGWKSRIPSLLLATIYLYCSVVAARHGTEWHFARGARVHTFLSSVLQAYQQNPNKLVLLAGMDSDLFWSGFYDRPFRLFGIQEIYLAPGSETAIGKVEGHPIDDFVYPPGPAVEALMEDQARVYKVIQDGVVDFTAEYYEEALKRWKPELSKRVDVGVPSFAKQLGPSWYPIEDHFRWMPRSATVKLAGPKSLREHLFIRGYCPPSQFQGKALNLTVFVDGHPFRPVQITPAKPKFEFEFPLPEQLLGKDAVEVEVDVDRTRTPPGDNRELGLVFGVFEIR